MPCDALLKGADSVWCRKKRRRKNACTHILYIFHILWKRCFWPTNHICHMLHSSSQQNHFSHKANPQDIKPKLVMYSSVWRMSLTKDICFFKNTRCIIVISSAHKASIIAVIQTQKTKPSYAFQNSLQEDPKKRNRGACFDLSVLSLSCCTS